MRGFIGRALIAVLTVGLCGLAGAFAADMKTKEANKAHSNAPAAIPEGAPGASGSTNATGESLQGLPSPEMTKFVSAMRACHKGGKGDMTCHDRVMKDCEDKMTKEECAKVMSEVKMDRKKKM